MPLVDLVVRAPHALTMAGDGVGYRADIALAVDRGRIVALGPVAEVTAEFSAERTLMLITMWCCRGSWMRTCTRRWPCCAGSPRTPATG